MNYSLKLEAKAKEPEMLLSLLKADISGDIKKSKIAFGKKKDAVVCSIGSPDAVSLKASVNSIIKTLQVDEKAKGSISTHSGKKEEKR